MIEPTDPVYALLERLVAAHESIAESQKRIADSLTRQSGSITPTDSDERAAIAAMCQLQERSGRWTISEIARMIGIPRTTLNDRAKNWPTFQRFVAAQTGNSPRRAVKDGDNWDAADGVPGDDLTDGSSGDDFFQSRKPR